MIALSYFAIVTVLKLPDSYIRLKDMLFEEKKSNSLMSTYTLNLKRLDMIRVNIASLTC